MIMIMDNHDYDDHENNDDTWQGEAPYEKSEHNNVWEDCGEIGNLEYTDDDHYGDKMKNRISRTISIDNRNYDFYSPFQNWQLHF